MRKRESPGAALIAQAAEMSERLWRQLPNPSETGLVGCGPSTGLTGLSLFSLIIPEITAIFREIQPLGADFRRNSALLVPPGGFLPPN